MVDFENDIKNCIAAMEHGGTILYPTDTIWGLGCDALDEAAIDKVYALKQRPKEKSLIILLADARDILKYVAAPPPDIIDIVTSFERPTTVIYDGAIELPGNAVNADGSIGIRVTTDPFCKALIKRFRRPIVSTSANISGQPSAPFFDMIDKTVVSGADYVVQYRRGDTVPRTPSQIVKINEDGSVIVLRA